jgi:hypothetical protein
MATALFPNEQIIQCHGLGPSTSYSSPLEPPSCCPPQKSAMVDLIRSNRQLIGQQLVAAIAKQSKSLANILNADSLYKKLIELNPLEDDLQDIAELRRT